jgi:hypothetical protein
LPENKVRAVSPLNPPPLLEATAFYGW